MFLVLHREHGMCFSEVLLFRIKLLFYIMLHLIPCGHFENKVKLERLLYHMLPGTLHVFMQQRIKNQLKKPDLGIESKSINGLPCLYHRGQTNRRKAMTAAPAGLIMHHTSTGQYSGRSKLACYPPQPRQIISCKGSSET